MLEHRESVITYSALAGRPLHAEVHDKPASNNFSEVNQNPRDYSPFLNGLSAMVVGPA